MTYIRFDTEKFISEIQCRPCLWNTNLEEYNDKICKNKAWEEVAEVLYDNWPDVKVHQRYEIIKELQKKWKGLRDYFARRKSPKDPVIDDMTMRRRRRAPFLDMLSFLSVTKNPNKTAKNTSGQTEWNTNTTSIADSEESQSSDQLCQQHEADMPVFPEVLLTPQDTGKHDPDLNFLLSILPDMKSMTPRQNFEFRYEIMNVIKNMKYDSSSLDN